jgi:hypothetical protein
MDRPSMQGRSSARSFKHAEYLSKYHVPKRGQPPALCHAQHGEIIPKNFAHVARASVASPESVRQSPSSARARMLSGCFAVMLRSNETAPATLPLVRIF